jgi:hypothetical protein
MKAVALSPIDPLRYAMLCTRALSHINRDDFAAARDWAERGAAAPNAHVHIRAIAAVANELAGDRAAAERRAAEIRRNDRGFRQATFFEAFPFRDARTRATFKAALDRLGL